MKTARGKGTARDQQSRLLQHTSPAGLPETKLLLLKSEPRQRLPPAVSISSRSQSVGGKSAAQCEAWVLGCEARVRGCERPLFRVGLLTHLKGNVVSNQYSCHIHAQEKEKKMSLKVPKCINSHVLLARSRARPDFCLHHASAEENPFYCVSSVTKVTRQDNH